MDHNSARSALEEAIHRIGQLVYQPMLEVMSYFRTNGFITYFVTGGGKDFVRAYCEKVYGVPLEQVVGTVGGLRSATTRWGIQF